MDGAAEADVDALAAEYEQAYQVVRQLRAGGERHDSLRYAARVELGPRHFLDGGGYGLTTNFDDLGGLRQSPSIAVQRLLADGYGFGAEGDWKTAALLRTLKASSAGRGTSSMED